MSAGTGVEGSGLKSRLVQREHVHVWVHVASRDWQGRPVIVCRCACGETLTPEQIVEWRKAAGL